MAKSNTIRALEAKRAELAGDLAQLALHRSALRMRIKELDAVIRILGGQSSPVPHGRKRRWVFRRGELQRLVFGVIRVAGDGVSNADVASAIIAQMDWDTSDPELRKLVAGKVKDVRKPVARGATITPPAANTPSTGG